MIGIEILAGEAARLHAALDYAGRRAMEALRVADPAIVNRLIQTFGKEEGAAAWLVSRTADLDGRSALELLAQGQREEVMLSLHHLRYGRCS
ncbi:antitoxin Xre/MbcA/ParS toxin-binding domain-containing protein [Paraburkholderia sp. HP33-1]|uniref:antitoxin Xre/MbcA/ParS toxin-binding domain-containing protein n=1 Tax=Paraburkholderia sp. HP33-1 TaxID=2883243 RepID=UPI001F371B0D|nr:antitoxin Xre/MbcA/ParS toxin-binding domain-containing protein [Paraburkholderia sp. HP33-1]